MQTRLAKLFLAEVHMHAEAGEHATNASLGRINCRWPAADMVAPRKAHNEKGKRLRLTGL